MDPHSRRDAWALIRASAEGRTIILTTHFMDEADLLSDRIAIMAKGKVQCCGSSMFLKRLYGVGYSFTVSLSHDASVESARRAIHEVVAGHVPEGQLLSAHGTELLFRLPFDAAGSFPNMLRAIDAEGGRLHVDSYGISVTTLEEVFIAVGHGVAAQPDDERKGADFRKTLEARKRSQVFSTMMDDGDVHRDPMALEVAHDDLDGIEEDAKYEKYESPELCRADPREAAIERRWNKLLGQIRSRSQKHLFGVHVAAMLCKKFNTAKRDKRSFLCQMVLPVLFMLFGFAVIDLQSPAVYPRLKLDLAHFGQSQPVVPFNEEAASPILPLVAAWDHMPASFGSLLPVVGYNESRSELPWEYGTDGDGVRTLRTFADSMLEAAAQRPSKYVALYFATKTGPILSQALEPKYIEAASHIAVGANISSLHSLPIAVNAASNLALKSVSPAAEITAFVQPLPTTPAQSESEQQVEALLAVSFISFGVAFFPVAVIYNVVAERQSSAKLQLLVSGTNSVAYWTGSYLFDSVVVVPPSLFAVALVIAFEVSPFTGDAMAPFFLVLLCYGLSIVPFSYCLSWCFRSSVRAQYASLLTFLVVGYFAALTTFILDFFPSTKEANKIVKPIVRAFPSYCCSKALLNLATADLPFAGLWEQSDGPFHWEITGRLLSFMAAESVLYFAANLLVEYSSTIPSVNEWLGFVTNSPKETPLEIDRDVAAEQKRLKALHRDGAFDFSRCGDPIILSGLRKVFSTNGLVSRALNGCRVRPERCVTAVQDLWFSVPRGQIFGFLGTNGAGKTSTMSMLCGKFPASEGRAYINGLPISKQVACRRMIGYCPQFDALFDLLTAREHLKVYGMIKGLSAAETEAEAEQLIDALTLSECADQRAATLSGGNKRKLSVAMAMIGSPPIVFLDEPSTGMDPVSKRSMWDFISRTMNGRSVLLTTHSMEECEALCHRIGIMVKGQLRCLGTSQRLKQRFGNGFQLEFNIPVQKQQALRHELNASFGEGAAEELEAHEENIKFAVRGHDGKSLADMFEKLELIHSNIGIDGGYALSQTTLEDIFIRMASQQQDTQGLNMPLQGARTMNQSASPW